MTQTSVDLSVVAGSESGAFTPTDTGMTFADDLSKEQWREILKTLKLAESKSRIWLADCIEFGRKRWGAEAVELELAQLEFDLPMVRSALTITEIPITIRYPNLDSEHYIELSKVRDKKAQAKWAKIASEQSLTPAQLRFSIAAGEVVDTDHSRQLKTGVVTIQGIRQSFDLWFKRVGGADGVLKMDQEHQEEILEELDTIVEFALYLRKEVEDGVEV